MSVLNQFIRVSRIDEIGMPHSMTFQGDDAAKLSQELFQAWRRNPGTIYTAIFEYRGGGQWQRTQWEKPG